MIEGGYNSSRFMVQMFLEVMSSSKSSNSDSKLTPSSRSHSTRGSARISRYYSHLNPMVVTCEECCWGGRQSGAEHLAPSVRSRRRSATHFGPHGQG